MLTGPQVFKVRRHLSHAGYRIHSSRRWHFTVFIAAIATSEAAESSAHERLSGNGFAPATTDAWKQDDSHPLVNHVLENVKWGDMGSAITEFDAFSEQARLGMHLGSQKGDVIESTISEAWSRIANSKSGKRAMAVLEIGAHAGDGTMRIVRPLLAAALPEGQLRHTVISIETNPGWGSGCRAVVAHAGGDDVGHQGTARVQHEVLVARSSKIVQAANAAREAFGFPYYDVVLLDHDHGRYLKDLKQLVAIGAIAVGGIVHADNAGRNKAVLTNYLDYVQRSGPFTTRFEEIREPYRDSVAISEYMVGSKEL